jgi:AraC family transcriptional regulator
MRTPQRPEASGIDVPYPIRDFLPLLAFIQTHLEEDLSLSTLSARVNLSPTQLHKAFRATLGETPRSYVERLRLEHAAFRLLIRDETILDLALDHGFASHETFTRAFHRRFGVTPAVFRVSRRTASAARLLRLRADDAPYSLSATRVRKLAPMHLATIRHVGRYEDVPDTLFAELAAWADARGLGGPRVWIGIGHDAPGITPEHQLRFDAALSVPEPIESNGNIVGRQFPGGMFAVTTHAGPFSSLAAAYADILPRALSIPRTDLIGLPAVEFYQTTEVLGHRALNVTDICLPVKVATLSRPSMR